MMRTLGICFGATTFQAVRLLVEDGKRVVEDSVRIPHEGNPRKTFIEYVKTLGACMPDRIAVTGRAFRSSISLTTISEPEAIEYALKQEYRENFPDLVVSSGGETQLVYALASGGGIRAVHSGNKCASGTGEFFLQQIRRMDLSLDEAVDMASRGTAHRIAGRCSVFCKSDCTHALNKGEPRENIAAGLCLMMAEKITDLVKDMPCEKVALIGGGSLNSAMVEILRTRFKELDIPAQARCFEAYGAALWASVHPCIALTLDFESFFKHKGSSFGNHLPLKDALNLVQFKETAQGKAAGGDVCILGLDVGSTTTKAVLLRKKDTTVLASVYLRTNGDPVGASRNCYRAIRQAIGPVEVAIVGLGVTGSGRQIAALHGLTDNVINEIIAHATAAAHFDKDVDTIFEIGGQDAKYTYLTGGVPSDYAMNEACSAGTGSFLEESARESLNVPTEEIGSMALCGGNPPNFTDQCSAFISSDIKIAGQEGIGKNDILAGLVYSICLNYLNRVKGSRPVGKKIFMQGGVCYNKAVPVAMASLMQTSIIVPPDPGLMGAYGVALEVAKRIDLGISAPTHFDLSELVERDALREGSFTCNGGSEKCDRKCEIARIKINGKMYPFGGVCNKYYNLRLQRTVDTAGLDLVALRQKLLFEQFGVAPKAPPADQDRPERTIGIMRSFLTHAMYPLYSHFFNQLGFTLVFPDRIDPEGITRIEAAFCLPAELTHGSFFALLAKSPDYIFLPHVTQIPVPKPSSYTKACVFVQGEAYYLKTTFRREIEQSPTVILSPIMRMDSGYEGASDALVEMASVMGIQERDVCAAWSFACERQLAFEQELQTIGRKALQELEDNPSKTGVVLFGRPYNSFADDANMGIPHKVASRGYLIIPFDMLPASDYMADSKMFWGMGQKIMKAAQFVKDRENLFGFYITNFSCGPDSFLLGFFRTLMKEKPSLTLELDQHTADAGIDTRIEAALDIIESFRRAKTAPAHAEKEFIPARVIYEKDIRVISSEGREYAITDPNVELVLPSMGRYGTEGVAAVMRSMGINTRALPVADKEVLLEGRKSTSCKECLPYIVTTGSFMKYMKDRPDNSKVTLFFMATGGGPCRLGQYCRALEQHIARNRFANAAVLTMSDENGYGGMGSRSLLKAWQSILVSDVFGDIRSVLSVAAEDREGALEILENSWKEVLAYFEGRLSTRFSTLLSIIAKRLSSIPLTKKPSDLPVISLIGEIYVRRDEFSRKNVVDYLEHHGFKVRVAPISEYMCYSNFVVNSKLGEREFTFKEQMRMKVTAQVQEWWEWRIKSILAESGLYAFEMVDVERTIDGVRHLVNVNFRGETILTVGLGLREILHDSCGVISIGPFGCMPSRMAESILKKEMNVDGKARMPGWQHKAEQFADIGTFPFLSLETDGSPFPQLVEANLEAFILQARRLDKRMRKIAAKKSRTSMFPINLYELVTRNGKPKLVANVDSAKQL